MSKAQKELGKKIESIRLRKKISINEIINKTGLHFNTITDIEKGNMDNKNLSSLFKYLNYINYEIESINIKPKQ